MASVNNTIACVEFSRDATFQTGNEIFLKVMGYQEKELVGKSFDLIMGDDAGVVMMWENLRLGKFFSGEFRVRNKAGKELWLSGTFNPITIKDDLPDKIIMLAQFTTQEKEKLVDLNATVNALKSTLPVMEFNEDFVCKSANEKALHLFGITRLQLRTKNILDLIAPHFVKQWSKEQTKIRSAEFSNLILPFVSDSKIVNYEVSVSLVRNYDGRISKIIMIFVRLVNNEVPVLSVN